MAAGNDETPLSPKESNLREEAEPRQPRTAPWKLAWISGEQEAPKTTPPAENLGSKGRALPGILSAVLLVLLAVAICTLRRSGYGGELPDEILGTWRTTDPRYAQTVLDIGRTTLTFGTVDRGTTSHAIARVEEDELDRAVLYTVHYRDEGGVNELSFFYTPIDSVIRFRNQRSLTWRRDSATPEVAH
jgi:hypothetical protein